MKKLIVFIIVIYAAFFLFTTKNETIIVKQAIEHSADGNWLIITKHKGTYQVPYDYKFNTNFITNWMILNLDAKDDFKTLSRPGTYIVRTYGIFGKRKITEILESEEDKPLIVDLYTVGRLYLDEIVQY